MKFHKEVTDDILNISIWDNDTFSDDDMICKGSISTSNFAKGGDFSEWVYL